MFCFSHSPVYSFIMALCGISSLNTYFHKQKQGLGPHMYMKIKYSSQFCHFVMEPDKISIFFNKNPAQWSFKSASCYTDVNCASCQPDKNQSRALAHIWHLVWALELILSRCGCHGSGRPDPSTSSGQRSLGSDGGSGQASRLNTLSGISGLWGRWRKSSLANVSLSGSLNHLQDTHTHIYTCYPTQACTHTHTFTLLLLANMGWYKDQTQWVLR